MAFTKITDTLNVHQARATEPTESASELKALFDQDVNTVKTRFNEHIDELAATTAADNIGLDALNVSAANVGDGIAEIQANLAEYVLGGISDNTITNAKLVEDIKIGSLALLDTVIKTSVVNAVNEVVANISNLSYAVNYGKYSQMSGGAAFTADGGDAYITFSTEDNDDFSAIDIGASNTKITIPSGLTTVKFYAKVKVTTAARDYVKIILYKNGSPQETLYWTEEDDGGAGLMTSSLLVYSLPTSVAENDYFELYIDFEGINSNYSVSAGTVFGMEVLN